MRGLATWLWKGKREWEIKRTKQKKCKAQEESRRERSPKRPPWVPGPQSRVWASAWPKSQSSPTWDSWLVPIEWKGWSMWTQATLVSNGGHHVLMPRDLSSPSGAPPSQFRRPTHRKVAMSQTESYISYAKCPQNSATAVLNAWDSMSHAQQWGEATLVPAIRKAPCPRPRRHWRLSKDRKQKYVVFL